MADEVTPQHEISAVELGAVAYAAFVEGCNGVDAHGVALPDFLHLHDLYKRAWGAAALAAAAAHVQAQPTPPPEASGASATDEDGGSRRRR